MVGRVTDEIRGYLIELGTDSGLLDLQLEELTAGTARDRYLLLRDYGPDPSVLSADVLAALSADELLDLAAVAAAIGLGTTGGLGQHVTSRGYRLLGQIPRLPQTLAEDLIDHFGDLQKLLSASAQDLRRVHGVDPALATRVREGLSRLAESALMERYS
jgi:diadenylate cyclase